MLTWPNFIFPPINLWSISYMPSLFSIDNDKKAKVKSLASDVALKSDDEKAITKSLSVDVDLKSDVIVIKGATKYDSHKLRWDLIPWDAVKEVVKIMTDGALKYAPNGWRSVPQARDRYFAALHRHLEAWWNGERIDPESGSLHIAHVTTNALFLLWFELTGNWPKDGGLQ